MHNTRLAIVGATGLVGRKMLELVFDRQLPFDNLRLFASANSAGETIEIVKQSFVVEEYKDDSLADIDIALFSAGSTLSKSQAENAKKYKTIIVDNSSAFRMDDDVPLVVPEINAESALEHDYIIANPNCSTIQMVMALKPLHDAYRIKRVVVSTYQSVTGSGKQAVDQLYSELANETVDSPVYPHQIAFNALPHIDTFQDDDYSKEERKMIDETQKILDDASIKISPTCVRIPTIGGHSESINLELEHEFKIDDVRELLAKTPGITVIDDPHENQYPTALSAHDTDDVYVGRIRRDQSIENGLHLWVVSDNLRKGAATNAVQIVEYLMKHSNGASK